MGILGFHDSSANDDEVIKTLYSKANTVDQIEKEKIYTESIIEDTSEVIDTLTPHDLRVLIKSEEELSQTKDFERIFPHKEYDDFLSFLDLHLYNDLLLTTWEKAKDSGAADIKWLKELCKDEFHLKS